MKVKTSITLSDYLIKEIDNLIEEYGNRSLLIEAALKEFLATRYRQSRDHKDLGLINANADCLNNEAKDVLGFQVEF